MDWCLDILKAIKFNPAKAYRARGDVYYLKGDRDSAIADYTQVCG